jgi:hypothetical protein
MAIVSFNDRGMVHLPKGDWDIGPGEYQCVANQFLIKQNAEISKQPGFQSATDRFSNTRQGLDDKNHLLVKIAMNDLKFEIETRSITNQLQKKARKATSSFVSKTSRFPEKPKKKGHKPIPGPGRYYHDPISRMIGDIKKTAAIKEDFTAKKFCATWIDKPVETDSDIDENYQKLRGNSSHQKWSFTGRTQYSDKYKKSSNDPSQNCLLTSKISFFNNTKNDFKKFNGSGKIFLDGYKSMGQFLKSRDRKLEHEKSKDAHDSFLNLNLEESEKFQQLEWATDRGQADNFDQGQLGRKIHRQTLATKDSAEKTYSPELQSARVGQCSDGDFDLEASDHLEKLDKVNVLDSERFKVPIIWDRNKDLIDIINENDSYEANDQPERVAEEILFAKAKTKRGIIEKNDTIGPGSYRINETQVVKNVHCPTMAKSNS